MHQTNKNHYDILIAGSGFAGSLTALILNDLGFKVCLLEKEKHPRFAIGESSTPVADMILRNLSSKYNLPWLHDFSRYGSWQKSHPEIVCGIKRGFSFFKHFPGKDFFTDENHSNELLVAASVGDMQSDTNWLRADVDAFLVNKVKETGIDYFDLTEIISAKKNTQWEFHTNSFNEHNIVYASFFIDATGSSSLLNTLFGIESSAKDFKTNSFTIFSHFIHTPRWKDMLQQKGISTNDFPYDPDNSALHQILDEGWLWMLLFNDERLSLGMVLNNEDEFYSKQSTESIWNNILKKYPSINDIVKDASLAAQPGKIIRSERLQRKIKQCFGPGWVCLPHTAGFVDPLFSSGIAHTLSGVEKIIQAISQHWKHEEHLQQNLKEYEHSIFEELKLMDLLIAGCYKTMAHFELFNAWSMVYFAALIAHEKRRIQHQSPGYFLNADDPAIQDMVQKSYADLMKIISQQHPSHKEIRRFTNVVRERIAPFNTAGLLDPSLKNMYQHTAVAL